MNERRDNWFDIGACNGGGTHSMDDEVNLHKSFVSLLSPKLEETFTDCKTLLSLL